MNYAIGRAVPADRARPQRTKLFMTIVWIPDRHPEPSLREGVIALI